MVHRPVEPAQLIRISDSGRGKSNRIGLPSFSGDVTQRGLNTLGYGFGISCRPEVHKEESELLGHYVTV